MARVVAQSDELSDCFIHLLMRLVGLDVGWEPEWFPRALVKHSLGGQVVSVDIVAAMKAFPQI